jgi:hypothetical protein
MTWPNKVSLEEPVSAERFAFYMKLQDLEKWCKDNLSSRDVLWKLDCENRSKFDRWHFYFAQPQDAIMFRLVNGV